MSLLYFRKLAMLNEERNKIQLSNNSTKKDLDKQTKKDTNEKLLDKLNEKDKEHNIKSKL